MMHVASAGHILLAGCDAATWINAKVTEGWGTLGNVLKIAAAIYLLYVLIFHRTLKAFVLALLLTGVAYWSVIGGGVNWVGGLVGGETNSAQVSNLTAPASGGGC
jgi:hypothetical protein